MFQWVSDMLSTSGVFRSGLVFSFLGLSGCLSTAKVAEPVDQPRGPWPAEAAARRLAVVKPTYVIYANNKKAAGRLAESLECTLVLLRADYGINDVGTGVIFAIGYGDEPDPGIRSWLDTHPDCSRSMSWTETGGFPWVSTDEGRPYCLARHAYFRESFVLPSSEAHGLSLPADASREDLWYCFLTTDDHWRDRYAARSDEFRRKRAECPKDAGELAMAMLHELLLTHYQYIDRDLMRLQRRETVCLAILSAGDPEGAEDSVAVHKMRRDIDKRWAELWLGRPRD
jgi:hypothetical protein